MQWLRAVLLSVLVLLRNGVQTKSWRRRKPNQQCQSLLGGAGWCTGGTLARATGAGASTISPHTNLPLKPCSGSISSSAAAGESSRRSRLSRKHSVDTTSGRHLAAAVAAAVTTLGQVAFCEVAAETTAVTTASYVFQCSWRGLGS